MHGMLDRRSTWTDEEGAYLRANAGRMSASAMAKALGRSRNAVLGKADRLGVHMGAPGRNEKPAEPPPPPPRATRREITLARQQGSTETDTADPPARVVADEGEGQPAGFLLGSGGGDADRPGGLPLPVAAGRGVLLWGGEGRPPLLRGARGGEPADGGGHGRVRDEEVQARAAGGEVMA